MCILIVPLLCQQLKHNIFIKNPSRLPFITIKWPLKQNAVKAALKYAKKTWEISDGWKNGWLGE